MRRLTVRLITALFTFLVGMSAAELHLTHKAAHETAAPLPESRSTLKPTEPLLDPTIHQATLCELIRHPYAYDRKIIRLQTIYDNGIDEAGLVGTCDGQRVWLIATPALEPGDKAVEAQASDKLSKAVDSLWKRGIYPLEVDVDVVGRFYARGGGGPNPWFAILNAIDARPARRRR